MRPAGGPGASDDSLWRLLYRYLWPFPYFRDVTRGKKLERQQSYRHNRAMRAHLPAFALKWALLTALCFGFGTALGSVAAPVVVTACFFVTGSWTLVVCVLLLTAWFWLTRFPELY
ncbi:MAG: hypothetical protein IT531_12160 [Burkholderiales bacterium]|nr:hypothetical protein [Burkholderiales bacterium]